MFNFENLSVYADSRYSSVALSDPSDIAKVQKELGANFFTITDLSSIGSFPAAFQAAKENDMGFIPGTTILLEPKRSQFAAKEIITEQAKILARKSSTNEERVSANKKIAILESQLDYLLEYTEITALAINNGGFKNLLKIFELRKTNNAGIPMIDFDELVNSNANGIIFIVGSGSPAGELIRIGEEYEAKIFIEKLISTGSKVFAKTGIRKFIFTNRSTDIVLDKDSVKKESQWIRFAKDCSLPLIWSSPSCYPTTDDVTLHNALKQVSSGGFNITCYDGAMMSWNDVNQVINAARESFNINLQEVLTECQHNESNFIALLENQDPVKPVTAETLKDEYSQLLELIEDGWRRLRKGTDVEEISNKRWRHELAVIEEKKFTEYFLNVYKFIAVERELGILLGPGRGSATGSEVLYLLGISQCDPLKHGLYFERFMNVSRNELADIDWDSSSVYPGKNREIYKEFDSKRVHTRKIEA